MGLSGVGELGARTGGLYFVTVLSLALAYFGGEVPSSPIYKLKITTPQSMLRVKQWYL